jgi:hypothetical protein
MTHEFDTTEDMLQQLVRRLEQTETRLATLTTRLERSASAPPIEDVSPDLPATPRMRVSLIAVVSILALGATLVVISISLAMLNPGEPSSSGLAASFNREMVQTMHTSELYANLRAYATFRLQDELQKQLTAALDGAAAEDTAQLERELGHAQQMVAASRIFFPLRYLNRDGSYDRDRHLGEAWASAAQAADLNPQPHFLEADAQRLTGLQLIWLLLWVTIALCLYELIHLVNRRRRLIRLSASVLATSAVLFVAVSVWLIARTI